jgi:hypothetical protein
VGDSFPIMVRRVLAKPYIAEVFTPFELVMGFLMKAKWAR